MRAFGLWLLTLAVPIDLAAQNPARPDQFRRLDANRDGRLTQAEFAGHPGNFRALDCDHDGLLTESEYVNRYRCDGAPPAAAPLPADAFAVADLDRDGVLRREEWRGAVADFNRFDRNNDQRVTRAEFAQPPDPNSPEGRFQAKDSNNDGVLSRREWRDEEVAFHRADQGGDGLVTLHEYMNLPAATPAEARFDRSDTDGDGVLDRREWRESTGFDQADRNRDGMVTLHEYLNQPPVDYREARFDDMDHNGDGLLTRYEWHGDRDSFEQMDRNDDGVVTSREFIQRRYPY
jgi:Ca2+-binding EF-hand superfamily protein